MRFLQIAIACFYRDTHFYGWVAVVSKFERFLLKTVQVGN